MPGNLDELFSIEGIEFYDGPVPAEWQQVSGQTTWEGFLAWAEQNLGPQFSGAENEAPGITLREMSGPEELSPALREIYLGSDPPADEPTPEEPAE